MARRYPRRIARAALLAGMWLVAAPSLRAQLPGAVAEAAGPSGRPLWELGLGAGAGVFADYPASDQYQLRGLPFPYVIYRGRIFKSDSQGVRATALSRRRLELDFSFSGAFPAHSGGNRARAGMPDLDYLVEGGPNLRLELPAPAANAQLYLNLPLRAVFSSNFSNFRYRGLVLAPSLALWQRLSPRWRVVWSVGSQFASARLQDYFYTVAPQYALPDRPTYQAHGGYLGSHASASLRYRLTSRFALLGFAQIDSYAGAENANSPLFRSHLGGALGLGFTWSLWQSASTVDSPR